MNTGISASLDLTEEERAALIRVVRRAIDEAAPRPVEGDPRQAPAPQIGRAIAAATLGGCGTEPRAVSPAAMNRGEAQPMKFNRQHFCCAPKLLRNIDEMQEIEEAIANVAWSGQLRIEVEGRIYEHQSGYNRALAGELRDRGWTMQPKVCTEPGLIGDASKNDVFVEVQFGNSSTLYRDSLRSG